MSDPILTLIFSNGEVHEMPESAVLVTVENYAHQGNFNFNRFFSDLGIGYSSDDDDLVVFDNLLSDYRVGELPCQSTFFLQALLNGFSHRAVQ